MVKYFIHFPKCGGTTIESIIKEKKDFICKNHHVFSDLNEAEHGVKELDKIWFSSIRNPIDYYYSFWRYRVNELKNSNDPFHKRVKNKASYKYLSDEPDFQKYTECLFDNNSEFGPMTKNVIRYWFGNNEELFVKSYYNEPKKKYLVKNIVKLENLKNDLKKIGLNDEDLENIQQLNMSGKEYSFENENPLYLKYYNQELLDIIYKRDKYIFDAFDYDMPKIKTETG
jgi:hypothetical protein